MPRDPEAPGEGERGHAGHLQLDGPGAPPPPLAPGGQAVAADGAWLPAGPDAGRLDARQVRPGNEVGGIC